MKSIIILAAGVFIALQSNAQKSAIFAPGGKAINGYDVVAFFNEAKPVKGSDSLTYQWKEATWMFSSQRNKDLFMAAPEKYAPQYGGFCAYGTSQGHKSSTEVDTWTIVNEKLYFNYNKNVQKSWNKDQQTLIEKADKIWPDLEGK